MKFEQLILKEYDLLFDNRVVTYSDIIGPASDEQIVMAEVAIGLAFPMSYRIFLSRYGAVRYGDHEIFGLFDELANEDFGFSNVVAMTILYRSEEVSKLLKSDQIISIAADQDGTEYYIYSHQHSTDKIPVYASTPNFIHRKIADDFLDFIRQLIKCDTSRPFGF